jgi:hypothetical protein
MVKKFTCYAIFYSGRTDGRKILGPTIRIFVEINMAVDFLPNRGVTDKFTAAIVIASRGEGDRMKQRI